MEIDPAELMKLADALAKLPAIKPRLVRDWLHTAYLAAVAPVSSTGRHVEIGNAHDEVDLGTRHVPTAALGDMFIKNQWGVHCITPAAAQLLISLYVDGAIPEHLRKPGYPGRPAPDLMDYTACQTELETRTRMRREAEVQKANELTQYVINPDLVPESAFTYSLLNDLFYAKLGPCGLRGQTLHIGGIVVTKSLVPYKSNSGKKQDFTVVLRWTGSDGAPHEVSKESLYGANRRNDASRNWGLPD